MARVFGCTVSRDTKENVVWIHVHGDMLPCSTHQEIINLIGECEGMQVCFTVENPSMLLQIRESVPFEWYHSLDIRKVS